MHKDKLRLLPADEVGLGKKIEAGLIYKEMKLRKEVKRVMRSENVWQVFDRVVCSLDSIKPMEGRKGCLG